MVTAYELATLKRFGVLPRPRNHLLPDQVALQLGDGAQGREREPTYRRARVDALLGRDQRRRRC